SGFRLFPVGAGGWRSSPIHGVRMLSWLRNRSGQTVGQPNRVGRTRTYRTLALELLEDRTVPSNIVWVNRLTATDTFTPAERAVVDKAVAVWSNLIVDLHTLNDTLNLTILGGANSKLDLGNNILALTDTIQVDGNGRPVSARIRLDATGA